MTTAETLDGVGRERLGVLDYTISLPIFQSFSHSRPILGNETLDTPEAKKLVECKEVKQLQFPAPTVCLVIVLVLHEATQPLHLEGPAVRRRRVVKLDETENAVRIPATSAELRDSLEDHLPLMYIAEASRLDPVHSSPVSKKSSRRQRELLHVRAI